MRVKFDSDEVLCPVCGKERKSLTKHMRKLHPEKCEWDCPTCGESFPTRKGMRRHHSLSHGESLLWSNCENCDEEYLKSDEERRFCSNECYGEWLSENWVGKNHRDWKEGIEIQCNQCSDEFEVKPSIVDSRRFCSRDCYSEWLSENVTKENHHLWEGGYVKYYGENWWRKRQEVLERDGQCRICANKDGLLDVHHITLIKKYDEPEKANTMDNLIVLCRSCHTSVENGTKECPEPQ